MTAERDSSEPEREPREATDERTNSEATVGSAESVDEFGRSRPARVESDDPNEIVPEPLSTPVRTGTIDGEHAAFVVLGALATVVVFLHITGVAA